MAEKTRRGSLKLFDQKKKKIKCNIDILKIKKSHGVIWSWNTVIITFKRFLFSCKWRTCKLKCRYSFVHILDKGTNLPMILFATVWMSAFDWICFCQSWNTRICGNQMHFNDWWEFKPTFCNKIINGEMINLITKHYVFLARKKKGSPFPKICVMDTAKWWKKKKYKVNKLSESVVP